MDLIRASLERPIAVMAAVIMVVMFGVVALQTIPIQLTPDVRKPILVVSTNWAGAAPAEIEREILNEQEDVIKSLVGLEKMTSRAEDGKGSITLEFQVGQNMDKALLLLANRLDRVSEYPDEAKQPRIRTSSSEDNPIAWFVITRAEGNDRPIHTHGNFVWEVISDRIERVAGVSRVNVYGASGRQLRVIVDPTLMARYGLTVSEVVGRLRRANASVSAGDVEEGKRRYVVRAEGDLNDPDDVRAVVLRSERDPETGRVARVLVGDIADVAFDYRDPVARIRFMGKPALAMNAVRDSGANVIETMEGIRKAITELNESALPNARLELRQVYDETVYITSAVDLVKQNIYVGGTLAALVLLLFLRSIRATLVVSLAIPVSVIGSFVAMAALGRSINVISLAGLAFAVGMVVDAAIVVLENIYRLHQEGRTPWQAAYEGARQVWGAVLVSALTTVMVFIPILIMQLEVGQLFRDIAVAISVSVSLSLIVAITLIPALSNYLFGRSLRDARGVAGQDIAARGQDAPAPQRKRLRIPVVDDLAAAFVTGVLAFTRGIVRSRPLAFALVLMICGAAAAVTWKFLPKLEYLPEGNRNLVIGWLAPPPGYNLDTMAGVAERLEDILRPHWASVTGPESAPGEPVKISRFFFVTWRQNTIIGAAAVDPSRASELVPVISKPALSLEPGTFGRVSQRSLFGRGIGGSRAINLDITGPDLEKNLAVALRAVGHVKRVFPDEEGNQMRPRPGLELGSPEVRVIPDRIRLADNGVSARELGDTVDAFNDGLRVAEITVDGKRRDLVLIGPYRNVTETQGINSLPVVTEAGRIISVGELADVTVTSGPIEIRRLEGERAITLEIFPASHIPLEAALETVQTEVIDKLRSEGMPPGVQLSLSGTADKLTETWDHMMLDLVIAIIIVYLVMAVLFESFLYPLIIILSVPLATAGGVLGLGLLNMFVFQPLDMLTLLGFIILIGIVVNNAILLVHQTLANVRGEGMPLNEAIVKATHTRIRPIFMSTLTSVFGMLPLVLFPGAGSELYRGLGTVVIGGLSLSALLTLAIIPPLLGLLGGVAEGKRTAQPTGPVPHPAPGE
ncbi:MAG: efflux RND transporter permease subunit [Alphaproteobacteria bacterium]|nr:efflux RND transporter permease subunit [Alphaproteobacteria bacterium]